MVAFPVHYLNTPREYINHLIDKTFGSHQEYTIATSYSAPARGRNENYQTPEQKIPATQLDYPWESCVTLTKNWGWDPHPEYKSPRAIIDLLAEITAKGGSLLLGVGPRPDGLIEEEAACRPNVPNYADQVVNHPFFPGRRTGRPALTGNSYPRDTLPWAMSTLSFSDGGDRCTRP